MMNLGLKSTFPRLCNTVVKKRELIIEEVHIYMTEYTRKKNGYRKIFWNRRFSR